MDHNKKLLLQSCHSKELCELIEDHVKSVEIDDKQNTITLFVDKLYAFNIMIKGEYITNIISCTKKALGDKSIVIKYDGGHIAHDRENLVPYMIHYK